MYATAADLAPAWLSTAPPGADRLLGYAARLVRRATLTAVYDVDATGTPTAPAVVAALRDATCSQVAAWVTASIDPAAGVVPTAAAPVSAKQLGSASISYDTAGVASVTALQARAAAATSLCKDAALILADAGLLGGTVVTGR